MADLGPLVGVLCATTFSGGGLWLVVRHVVRYLTEFLDRCTGRVALLEAAVERLDGDVTTMKRKLLACHLERQALRTVLAENGIPWDPSIYDSENGRADPI